MIYSSLFFIVFSIFSSIDFISANNSNLNLRLDYNIDQLIQRSFPITATVLLNSSTASLCSTFNSNSCLVNFSLEILSDSTSIDVSCKSPATLIFNRDDFMRSCRLTNIYPVDQLSIEMTVNVFQNDVITPKAIMKLIDSPDIILEKIGSEKIIISVK